MTRILVVDDETDLEVLIKQRFRKKIREDEYNFHFAFSGAEALEVLDSINTIDIMLCDINMPHMDGLSLLQKINERKLMMKTVMVSAYGDMHNIRTAMNLGAFDFVTKPIDFADLEITLDKVIKSVEQTRQTIAAIRENNILKMYVDRSVLNFMSGHAYENSLMLSETIEATVAFIDLCSFSTISESAAANEVIDLLNGYFDIISQKVTDNGGYIDKYIGDAVMAVFRGAYHTDRALDCCLDARDAIQQLTPLQNPIAYLPNVSIGVNTGSMVSGNTGSSTLKRLDFTVIGDTVNIAQRLQSKAHAGQILLSQSVYDISRESFSFNNLGPCSLKNKVNPVVVYELLK